MHKPLIFGLLACCLFSISSAQSLINQDEIVVSDNKLEEPRATKTKRVIRLEAEELQRYAGQPLALVLNNLTGIEISGSRGAQGQNLGLYARGGNNRQILVLLDGLPINDPSQPASDFDLRLIDQQEVLRLPKHKVNVLLTAELGNQMDATANYHWVSSRLDTDFTTFETLSLDPYGLLDLTLAKRLSPKAQLSLQLFNVLNTDYVEIIGFSTRGRNLSLAYQVKI